MNVSQSQPSRASSSRILFWLPIFVASCAAPASNVKSTPALFEAHLFENPSKVVRAEPQERKTESRASNIARVEVSSDDKFTITYDPSPSEDQAVALNHGMMPTQNWWTYETDTMSATLMAGEVTWVMNPATSVKVRSDGLITKYQVTGFDGTGSVNVQVFKGTSTTPLFSVNVTPEAASSGTTQGVRMVHYTDNKGYIEITSNNKEIELEVGGFLFP